jgi:hypothetical protein
LRGADPVLRASFFINYFEYAEENEINIEFISSFMISLKKELKSSMQQRIKEKFYIGSYISFSIISIPAQRFYHTKENIAFLKKQRI